VGGAGSECKFSLDMEDGLGLGGGGIGGGGRGRRCSPLLPDVSEISNLDRSVLDRRLSLAADESFEFWLNRDEDLYREEGEPGVDEEIFLEEEFVEE